MNVSFGSMLRTILVVSSLAVSSFSFAQQGTAQSPTPQKVESVNIMDVGRAPNATSQAAIEAVDRRGRPLQLAAAAILTLVEPLVA